jgi:hypothetical protein
MSRYRRHRLPRSRRTPVQDLTQVRLGIESVKFRRFRPAYASVGGHFMVTVTRRMLASHERSLVAARGHSEAAGQIAAREMEIVRIKGALQRAEELSDDVAAAIERAL